MSVEASGEGVCVGSSDRSGVNDVGYDSYECHIEIDLNEESSDQRFSAEEKKLFDSFDEVLDMVNKTCQPTVDKPKIQKVPSMLRNDDKFKKCFEPKVFSFGPYYHNHKNCNQKMAIQIKVILAAEFLKEFDVKKEDLYENIKKKINELKDCYDDDLTNDYKDKDEELAWMFLVDGCEILWFMYDSVNFGEYKRSRFFELQINFDYWEFLAQDLFLLENQLPYQLLQLIIGCVSKHQKTKEDQEQSTRSKEDNRALTKEELLKSIYKFIFYRFRTQDEWSENKKEILKDLNDPHVHLLDLLRKKLIQPLHPKTEKQDLIEIIIGWTVFLCNKLKCNRNESNQDGFPVPHRNIEMLREAGINLKRSKTACLEDISFNSVTLKLPPIIIQKSTATMFLNLLGFEMCPDFQNSSEVSTYMYFMDELIDRTQDVEELREKNILQNQLGSNEEVVKLFNEISTHLFPNSKYHDVKEDIGEYFDNKGLMWQRKVSYDIHQYFKRRWSLLAFIGALLAVSSSIIQAVITALTYRADPKNGY